MTCRPDTTGANWFQCSLGTVGCPKIHNDRTPHCIACTDDIKVCFYHRADESVLEQSRQEYYAELKLE